MSTGLLLDVAAPDALPREPWALSDHDLCAALEEAYRAEHAAAARKLALLREFDARDLGVAQGAHSTAAWLRWRLLLSIGAARKDVALAAWLDRRSGDPVFRALEDGTVSVEQARVIARNVQELVSDGDVGIETIDEAVTTLVHYAGEHEPASLSRLGERIVWRVDPDLAEAREREALARAEARSLRDRHVTLAADGRGGYRLLGRLTADAAAVVRAALDPLCSPRGATPAPNNAAHRRTPGPSGMAEDAAVGGDDRTPGQRRADALIEVCRLVLAGATLPANGGDRPQVVVTIPFDPLTRALGIGTLDTGERVSAEESRRLACDATILPAVLDGNGVPLDVGRGRRLFTGALRKALVLRDRGCAFPGCDRPPRWCEGHHCVPWSRGGATALCNACLLCGYHHGLVHLPDSWTVRIGADGLPEFIPPAWVDPERRPRRNTLHLVTGVA